MTTPNRPRPLSDLVPALTKDIFGAKNLLFGKMLAEWTAIAGAEIAAVATPLDLKFSRGKNKNTPGQAVLHLSVLPAAALELSYHIPLLTERLNMFFGYAAIKDIKITQNKIMNNKTTRPVKTRPLTPVEHQRIEAAVSGIQENDLQTALKNLGQSIASRTEQKDKT